MSLYLPEQYSHIKMMAIDPGLNNTGVAIFDIDYHTRTIVSIQTRTIVPDKLPNNLGLDSEYCSDRTIKLYKLRAQILEILRFNNPCIVACEAPFYSSFRPSAYGALIEVISVIHSAILEHNCNIMFRKIEPLLVKKAVGAGSMKGKLDVKDCVSKIPVLMNALVGDLASMDEHSVDAIAVGYSFLKQVGE